MFGSPLGDLGPWIQGQSRRTGGAEGFTPKSIPLGPKSGIFHREKKGNTYATSTQFSCFLQNWSNCKTVLYLRDPPTGHGSLSSNGYCVHAVSHRKTRCVFFKPWGPSLSQFFRIHFKVVRLEFLATVCKREREKRSNQHPLSTGSITACSRWGYRQNLHQRFSFLVELCHLPMQVTLLVPSGSTTEIEWSCTRGRPHGIPGWRPNPHH